MFPIYKKIRTKLLDNCGSLKRYYLFGRLLCQKYHSDDGKKRLKFGRTISLPFQNQPIFYLKINRAHATSFRCIQHWVDIVHEMKGYIYFVCDNLNFEIAVMKQVKLYDTCFSFIPSDRSSMKKEINKIFAHTSALYRRIAFALLTPFVHAIEHGYTQFWNIDADDIEILLERKRVKAALSEVSKVADQTNINCFSQDIWGSFWFGAHWTFGVTYVRDPETVIKAVRENTNWLADHEIRHDKCVYLEKGGNFTIDWYLNYLSDMGKIVCKTFYIENSAYIHQPDALMDRTIGGRFTCYHNGNIFFPLLKLFYDDSKFSCLPICPKFYKIDIGLKNNSMYDYTKSLQSPYIPRGNLDDQLYVAREMGYISDEFYEKMIERK